MASYKLSLKVSAQKELKKIHKPLIAQIVKRIQALAADPRPHNCQMLNQDEGYFRVRQGDYRIIYEIDDEAGLVVILKIGHRSDVYK